MNLEKVRVAAEEVVEAWGHHSEACSKCNEAVESLRSALADPESEVPFKLPLKVHKVKFSCSIVDSNGTQLAVVIKDQFAEALVALANRAAPQAGRELAKRLYEFLRKGADVSTLNDLINDAQQAGLDDEYNAMLNAAKARELLAGKGED